jgi:hypothetical protein
LLTLPDTAFPFSFPSVGVSWPDDDLEQVCTDAFILLVVQFHAIVHPFGGSVNLYYFKWFQFQV